MAGLRAISILAALVALVASGCSSEPVEESEPTIRISTESLIEAEITGPAALGSLRPACPEVDGTTAGIGTSFQCTATTEDEQVIALEAVIDEEGRVQLSTTNIIVGPALPSFERAAVDALNSQVQSNLDYSAIDCGAETVVFPVDQNAAKNMVCALFDPLTQATYDVTLTITDIEGRQFSLVVADQPRA